MTPPFHPFTKKKLGDRVMAPLHPADHSRGYFYGTVIRHHHRLLVRWDNPPTYMSQVTDLTPAILCPEPSL